MPQYLTIVGNKVRMEKTIMMGENSLMMARKETN